LIERALQGELSDHLGYAPYMPKAADWTIAAMASLKTLQTDSGAFHIALMGRML
jgi:hypothetical protein